MSFYFNNGVNMMTFQKDQVTVITNTGQKTIVVNGKEYKSENIKFRVEVTAENGEKFFIPYTEKLEVSIGPSSQAEIDSVGDVIVKMAEKGTAIINTTDGDIKVDALNGEVRECRTTNGNITVNAAKVGKCSTVNGNVYN